MRCPNCGGQRLRIDVVFSGSVACEFQSNSSFELYETASLDSHWHDDSDCQCEACGWHGTVHNARHGSLESHSGRSIEQDLEQLQKEVDAGSCPAEIAEPVEHLIDSVRKLRVQVALLERINRALSKKGGADSRDTVLF